MLSSNNIEQFLYFSAGLFERSRAQALGKKRITDICLTLANRIDLFERPSKRSGMICDSAMLMLEKYSLFR